MGEGADAGSISRPVAHAGIQRRARGGNACPHPYPPRSPDRSAYRPAGVPPDGRRTVTDSVTSQVPLDPALFTRLRATEEKFVCVLPDHGCP
ncbi:hypothetical protein SVTN_37555 [Streptomyces vietnamensis]|uniref:Uncharacterized protein n=1 Tax=Streptomyces vietnamensis TaxID=362257 RepID=A0A0B5IF52_9ACTN|nr:hypothetical protein SVTN_37555 [Streptomyces vietnamensis]